jgi:IS4 transposase
MLDAIFERFVKQSPVSVMVRGLMERVLNTEQLNSIFENHAKNQYTRELLFSSIVDLMSLVVCGIYPSVNAAYRAKASSLNVSRTAVYDKLNGIELDVSAALLRETAASMTTVMQFLGDSPPKLLAPYQVRIIDGNCLAATDHRLEALKPYAAKALPGKSLVVLDPDLKMAIDVFPCEDGHAQERSLFESVLQRVKAGELWIADRNMCTQGFLFGICKADADFLIREHKSLPQQAISELEFQCDVETGSIFEQTVALTYEGSCLKVRRVVLRLKKVTRDGDLEIAILTSLPKTVASAADVAQLYRGRWSVETLFQIVTNNFEGEIQTLGYPKAALFSFCLALVSYNILAVVRRALGSVHGVGKIESSLSEFYLVDEIQGTYRGMTIACEPDNWSLIQALSLSQLADFLLDLAGRVNLKSFLKQPRSPKKKKPPLIVDSRHRHLSTARLLDQARQSP